MKNIFKNKKIRVYSLSVVIMSVLLTGIFMQSCNQDDEFWKQEVFEKEKSLNLTAPNGEKISENIFTLKELVSVSIIERFGSNKEFCITELEYIPIQKGYSVLIKYETLDGIKGGLIRTNDPSFKVSPNLTVKIVNSPIRLKSGGENSAKINGKTITCSDLEPNCECMPTFTLIQGGGVSYSCGSCQCTMTMTL